MITSEKNSIIDFFFSVYNTNLIRRKFNQVFVDGFNEVPATPNHLPIIFYLNHSSWWDGLIAYELSKKLKLDSFFMMDEKQLRELVFFRKLGAFSVDKVNIRQAFKSLEYAVQILNDSSNRALWIFPQGNILPNDLRPLKFYNGISVIIKKLKQSQVIPIAFKFEFLGNHKPDIFIKIGTADIFSGSKDFDIKRVTVDLAAKLTNNLEELNTDINAQNFSKFQKLI